MDSVPSSPLTTVATRALKCQQTFVTGFWLAPLEHHTLEFTGTGVNVGVALN